MAKGIASKTNFSPEDFTVVGFFYIGSNEDIMGTYSEDHRILAAQGHNDLISAAGQCDSCGTWYNHGAVVEGPEGFLAVGGICAAEYFGVSSVADFKRAEAAKIKARREMNEAALAFIEAHDLAPVLEHVWMGLAVDFPGGDYFSGYAGGTSIDIFRKLNRYGSLSEGQVNLLHKLHEEHHARQEEKAQEEAVTVAIPANLLEGRVPVAGVVLGTKWSSSPYGETLKMLVAVEADGGTFKLWGTVPSSIWDEVEKGALVNFEAAIQVSDDDPAFGFYSRPTKAKVNGSTE